MSTSAELDLETAAERACPLSDADAKRWNQLSKEHMAALRSGEDTEDHQEHMTLWAQISDVEVQMIALAREIVRRHPEDTEP